MLVSGIQHYHGGCWRYVPSFHLSKGLSMNGNFMIFSVDKSDYDEQMLTLNRRTIHRIMSNEGIEFETVLGCYEGVIEVSYLIRDMSKQQAIFELSEMFNQDSTLYVDVNFEAVLFFNDQGREILRLGKFTKVDEDTALKSVAYTKIGNDYYTCG